jgi:hypothetical protein
VRRAPSAVLIASALAILANPIVLSGYEQQKADYIRSEAAFIATRYGHLINGNKHPAELDRKSRQRRRARQTHPGTRGRS